MKIPPDKELVIVCTRLGSDVIPVAGSSISRCTSCGEPVWLAPSTLPYLTRATIRCSSCAFREVSEALKSGAAGVTFGGFLPGQLDELRRDRKDVS